MPKRKRTKRRRRRAPLVDLNLIKALNHELRQHILLGAIQGEVSPNELSKSLGEGLSQVSYHVKVLRDDCGGILRITRTRQRRGALEHFYRADLDAVSPANSIEQIFAMLSSGPDWNSRELRSLIERLERASRAKPEDK